MNLLHVSLLNQYIYSPKNCIHALSSRKKIYFLFIYLCFIPYLSYKSIGFSLFFYINIFYYPKARVKNNKKYITKSLSALFIAIYSRILLAGKIIFLRRLLSTRLNNVDLNAQNFPIFSCRLVLISIHYLLIINIIFKTTIFTEIVFCFSVIFAKNSNHVIQKIAFISTFACQYLDRIFIKIRNIILAIQLRRSNMLLIKSICHIYILCTLKLLEDIKNDAHKISSLLHAKNLDNNTFYIADICAAINKI
uniref:Uncharacterized protein n=1 Tax=Melanthalia intermedia TaxID=172989 RepID=A0A345UAP9_9FLOR|nr:hypothetical protein [Melanthalia intermedia]AXI97535.1 hypothetical protein [Melanthalia intermedia]